MDKVYLLVTTQGSHRDPVQVHSTVHYATQAMLDLGARAYAVREYVVDAPTDDFTNVVCDCVSCVSRYPRELRAGGAR